jgi:hypothetical protein
MIEYLIGKCPYCNYHWRAKIATVEEFKQDKELPKKLLLSCTHCKRRFDTPGSKKPTFWVEKHESHKALKRALTKYNQP